MKGRERRRYTRKIIKDEPKKSTHEVVCMFPRMWLVSFELFLLYKLEFAEWKSVNS